MQEVTLEGDRDHRRSSLLWQLYQRKVAVARTARPWKGRLSALGQRMEGPRTSVASYWTNGECTHHEQWIQQSKEVMQIRNQEDCVRWQHSINTNAAGGAAENGDIVMLDPVHNDIGRRRLLGIRERVRLIQE